MTKNLDCNGCFYEEVDPREGPCNSCFATAKYVHRDVFKDVDNNPVFKQTGKLSWEMYPSENPEEWNEERNVVSNTYPYVSSYGFEQPTEPADALRETFGKTDYDTVNKPRHYMLFESEDVDDYCCKDKGIEVRDVIEKLVGKLHASGHDNKSLLFVSDYVQMLQYGMRFMDKNRKEDLLKMRWYLDKMIEAYE